MYLRKIFHFISTKNTFKSWTKRNSLLSALFYTKYTDWSTYFTKLGRFNKQKKLSFSKDVRLPVQLQRAMAAEAEAAREARAKVS